MHGDRFKKKDQWRKESVESHIEHASNHLKIAEALCNSGLSSLDRTSDLVFFENIHHAATRMMMVLQIYHKNRKPR